MFLRTENVQTFVRLYPTVSSIIVTHVICWTFFSIETTFANFLLEKLIGINVYIRMGEYWRLFTPLFLHLHFGHMMINSLSLILFGPALEKMLGTCKFIIVYIWSGTFANVATLFFLPPLYSHLGASSAIFGLFGVYIYLIIIHKNIIDRRHAQIIITSLCIGIVMTVTNPNINTIAHTFGFLGGATIAPFIASRRNPYAI
ncbi:membrane associated rhomboid family serine protease [Anoxybacillus vitaminiphilus]|jgi:rhomboid protease GluP|uniref:Membrane associated rhomboid family serine protease n=1 Tax=Paranoxybacillus vitaminiphilus TaxID=581036 RepID=A0A327Y3S4_9BACL|nr:rhomboid family intramembrane serine protease [Anoxybacillus vitaminiphilus]RAK15683.1 membrane associated rhomboid family serine protease [Anoxybacillus vitaminiphilus]